MKKIFNKLILNREARLFDSHLYILKGFLAILTGYALFETHSFIGRDMISLLFGMMLTLEPVNTTGIKSGWTQVKASLVGGLVTALIVSLFGINFITVACSMAVTMYISLLIDWKSILPVAIFTSIYMTQVIQFTQAGEASMLITLQLRFISLGTGVLIAVIFNYIFSLLFYKSMVRKRVIFLLEKTSSIVKQYIEIMKNNDIDKLKKLKREAPLVFGDIDFVNKHIIDLSKEKKNREDIECYKEVALEIRDFNHYLLDFIMRSIENTEKKNIDEMILIKDELDEIANKLDKKEAIIKKQVCCDINCEDVLKLVECLSKIHSKLFIMSKKWIKVTLN